MSVGAAAPYDRLSEVYDHWVQAIDYEAIADRVGELASRPSPRCLDLCTGTASLPLILATRGWRVVGIDSSMAMLERARHKLDATSRPDDITLVHGDVDGDWPGGPFDVVACTSDSANYLTPAQLERLVRRARNTLAPRGALLLDLNSEHKLRDVFANSTYAEAHDTYAYIWRNRLAVHRKSIRFEIDLFTSAEEGRWHRHREIHTQYIHELDSMRPLLERAGFVVEVAASYGGEPLGPASDRWVLSGRLT